jgi:ornithine cyclodeaminase
MHDDDILIIGADDVLSILTGREIEIMEAVRAAYEAHGRGESSLPHSTFLRFPDDPANRIIALPAFLGGEFQTAGMKWIASFPANREVGMERASAVLIVNSTTTGRPQAIVEGSIISAKRTAASAALAALHLHREPEACRAGLIGCGLINLEIARFLLASRPALTTLHVFDTYRDRALQFKARAEELFRRVEIVVQSEVEAVLSACSLTAFATTAIEPHIRDLSACPPGATILHISLRDLMPEAILLAENIVDDVSHVCRAQTSVHLAEIQTGNHDFIRCTLAEILTGAAPRPEPDSKVVFSPFGLGVLDIALGKLVCDIATRKRLGTVIGSFLPVSWTGRREPVAAEEAGV